MTISINYSPVVSPGYTPRKSVRLFNVASVHDKGVNMVEIHMLFTDDQPTHDHVASVSVIPERE